MEASLKSRLQNCSFQDHARTSCDLWVPSSAFLCKKGRRRLDSPVAKPAPRTQDLPSGSTAAAAVGDDVLASRPRPLGGPGGPGGGSRGGRRPLLRGGSLAAAVLRAPGLGADHGQRRHTDASKAAPGKNVLRSNPSNSVRQKRQISDCV